MASCPIRSFLWMFTLLALTGCDATRVTRPRATPLAGVSDVAADRGGDTPAMRPALPWRIRATVATTPAAPPEGCVVYYTSVIEGTATHLGRFTGVGSTCITNAIQPDPDPPFVPAGPPPYLTADFTNPMWTLTASDGDELWIRGTHALAVISLTDGSLRAVGTQEIIGGTGRFAGATGEAAVGATNADGVGPDDFRGAGWIRLDAGAGGGT